MTSLKLSQISTKVSTTMLKQEVSKFEDLLEAVVVRNFNFGVSVSNEQLESIKSANTTKCTDTCNGYKIQTYNVQPCNDATD